jgi:hypothetical protein
MITDSISSNDRLIPQTLKRIDTRQTYQEVYPCFPSKLQEKWWEK